jgi:hypothetical protein
MRGELRNLGRGVGDRVADRPGHVEARLLGRRAGPPRPAAQSRARLSSAISASRSALRFACLLASRWTTAIFPSGNRAMRGHAPPVAQRQRCCAARSCCLTPRAVMSKRWLLRANTRSPLAGLMLAARRRCLHRSGSRLAPRLVARLAVLKGTVRATQLLECDQSSGV